jgi:hypothetical protein
MNAADVAFVPMARCFFAGTPSHQPHGQRELIIDVSAFISINEVLQKQRHIAALQITASPKFLSHVG